jgi:UDP-N-acetylglucosamine 2-epimerase (non-hydrolysing)
VSEERIVVTGNTVIDALFFMLEKIRKEPPFLPEVQELLRNGQRIILVTAHRRESFGEDLESICNALRTIATKFDDVAIVYPVHLNPNVQEPVYSILGGHPNVHLIPPLGYIPFVYLMSSSHLILTDSGGIQEEAPSLGKPVLVMRNRTERPEGIEAGSAILVGTSTIRIVEEVSRLLNDTHATEAFRWIENPYGDGHAAERIADYLQDLQIGQA